MSRYLVVLLYNLALLAALPFFLPVSAGRHLRRNGGLRGLRARLGLAAPARRPRISPGAVWIHLVSYGEVVTAAPFVETLLRESGRPAAIWTTTPTGYRAARKAFPELPVNYLPIDLPLNWPFLFGRYRPSVFISLEALFWPNLLIFLDLFRVPAVLINGRLSPRSFRRYLKARPLLAPLLKRVSALGMRSQPEADWIVRLGAPAGRVRATGSLKYDLVIERAARIDPESVRREYGLPGNCLVFGSIHPEEEALALSVSRRLLEEFPGLKIILAPRHLERSRLVELLAESGQAFQAVSSFQTPLAAPFLLLDRMGCLNRAYAAGRAAFVGGSLTIFGDGGHNLVEPAAFGRPVAFGPHAWNFREESGLLLDCGGGVLVRSETELHQFFRRTLLDPAWADAAGNRALEAVRKRTGGVERSVAIVRDLLTNGINEAA
ncbi:MAG TPA: glycosyltransferase N-terminal domain-containing protein [bacterium]|uniref:3-deoxy-D-manno-octulosonic acid transferase n=1 Tax=candidate division TA06 bacterium ADurb.Bin417 TaxID=1852828 RepID=A0A1V5MDM9_UNCT6|nr:MAG: 3-deoxy-D-manno-octulosonic acid transferase [candidate division TA06 bacterium ADurb.Bin417]HNQ35736.1 glycosyltransferase N-terminal domain-containing protein [bacterium]HNS48576.1 glycosyltransferase N-terminal domain-containing protein [bacterium]